MKDRSLSEITLRKFEHPGGLKGRDLVKKVCLSLGLLNLGDSRDAIVDILHVILLKKSLSSGEVEAEVHHRREVEGLAIAGITPPNLRRQLKRLKDLHLVEKHEGKFRIVDGLSLHEAFVTRVKPVHLDNITQRIEQYLKEVDCSIQE